jgi:allophanate hydrolase subunit 2
VEVRCEHAGALAVAGADLTATLDGAPLPPARGRACRRQRRALRARGAARARTWRSTAASRAAVLGSRATDLTSGLAA